MNAKILERIISFRTTHGIEVVKEIIYRKIFYQFSIVNKKEKIIFYKEKLENIKDKEDIFIVEALAAREYWNYFKTLTSARCDWYGRKPHNNDPINKLLDVGYHFLVGIITKIFNEINLPYELGLLHTAQSQNSRPLVYDYMEWLRPIVVDRALLVIIRKKKNRLTEISQLDIAIFINKLKKEMSKYYFNKELGYCITLEYWIRLNALNLMSSINHNKYPKLSFPSLRHESRCKINKKTSDFI